MTNHPVPLLEDRIDIVVKEIIRLTQLANDIYFAEERTAEDTDELIELETELAIARSELAELSGDVLPRAKRGLPVTIKTRNWN